MDWPDLYFPKVNDIPLLDRITDTGTEDNVDVVAFCKLLEDTKSNSPRDTLLLLEFITVFRNGGMIATRINGVCIGDLTNKL